jgi:hypothetical protein
MKNERNLLEVLLNNVTDFTTDLLELGYSVNESLKYGLSFIYNQKEKKNLSIQDYIELESRYLNRIHIIC